MKTFKDIKNIIYAVAILTGTIIGVGLFSLPYVTSKVGILVMLLYFLSLGFLVILVHLFFGELSLKTPDFKRLPGFAKLYLGEWGKRISLITITFGFLGAILAYLIVGGKFLENLLSPIFGSGNFIYTFIFFIAGAVLIFFGIKAIAKIEFWGLMLFFLILLAIFIKGVPFIEMDNLLTNNAENVSDFFLPYGVILFSLWGIALIPEVEEMLGKRKKMLKKTILIAILIAAAIYLFFVLLILGITGAQTTESAMIGLQKFLGEGMVNLGLLFGLITTFTSFIVLGLTFKKVLWYDLGIKKHLSFIIACFIPLSLFLLGIQNFISVISFVGGITCGIDGILILLMYKKIRPDRKFLVYPMSLIFLIGIIYAIVYFIK